LKQSISARVRLPSRHQTAVCVGALDLEQSVDALIAAVEAAPGRALGDGLFAAFAWRQRRIAIAARAHGVALLIVAVGASGLARHNAHGRVEKFARHAQTV